MSAILQTEVVGSAELAGPVRDIGLRCGRALSDAEFQEVRLETIFDCGKYDPQVGDVATLCRYPLLMDRSTWEGLASLAEGLSRETLSAEAELVERTELHEQLGLPRALRAALRGVGKRGASRGVARFMRFDFHPTAEGWRISEVNSDVPGGFIEGSGFSALMALRYAGTRLAGRAECALAEALVEVLPADGVVGLVHATAYTDDRQVMAFVGRCFEDRGMRPVLVAPDQVRWREGRAWMKTDWYRGEAAALLRFFPAEWLCNLRRRCGWERWFSGSATVLANPGYAVVTQTKRFPLVWDELRNSMPTWRTLLPGTVDPRDASAIAGEAVLKPALGRVGDGIGMAGVTAAREWKGILRGVRWFPRYWAAQERFRAVALPGPEGEVYPCLGVFTVDGRAAGIYGRVAKRPLIDDRAQDVAVLIVEGEEV
ncbi:MAG TPA: glutathionylspermidine synthase family protein [Phycisphaerae bacterium]|nr:glutathionylspermidine synthase family protein [Phycisphaerae bacterium]